MPPLTRREALASRTFGQTENDEGDDTQADGEPVTEAEPEAEAEPQAEDTVEQGCIDHLSQSGPGARPHSGEDALYRLDRALADDVTREGRDTEGASAQVELAQHELRMLVRGPHCPRG